MVRSIVRDIFFLGQRSVPAAKNDVSVGTDLIDTLNANSDRCVGMAANMIGKTVRIIAFFDGIKLTLMYNPEIISKSAPFETEESCLSLLGAPRKTTRFRTVKVKYQDSNFAWRTKTFTGFTAQIIQHETDHCNGILI